MEEVFDSLPTPIFFIIIAAMLASPLNAKPQSQPHLLRACYDTWAPLQMAPGGTDDREGILHDIFAEVFRMEGYRVEYRGPMPYARIIAEVEEGNCDVTPVTVKGVSKKALYPKTPIYRIYRPVLQP